MHNQGAGYLRNKLRRYNRREPPAADIGMPCT